MGKDDKTWQQRLDEAEAWAVRLQSDRVTEQDRQQFRDWLRQNKRCQKAFDKVVNTLEMAGALAFFPDLSPSNNLKHARENGVSLPKPLKVGFLAAACVLGLAVMIHVLYPQQNGPRTYQTLAGQQRTITLPDDSVVELNTRTKLKVSYGPSGRHLQLSRGEAWFEVVPDKHRPFVVDVGAGTVTAVGTAFNIHRRESAATITVTHGVVDVQPARTEAAASTLRINQQIDIDPENWGAPKTVTAADLLAWRDGRVVFDNTPLQEALKELNRYLVTPVRTSDPFLQDREISGTFSLDSPMAALTAVAASLNLSMEYTDNNKIRLAPVKTQY